MITKHGLTTFCKIDVENYEYEVLSGLSEPIRMLSFEFHAELYHKVEKCLNRLEQIGYHKFNLAFGEHAKFLEPEWLDRKTFLERLYAYRNDFPGIRGDIYAYHE